MARRGRNWRKQEPLGDPADPRSLGSLIAAYLDWLRIHNYSEVTVYNRDKGLRYFAVWCSYRGLTRPLEITRPILERYQRWLFYYRKTDGKPLSFRSQHLRLVDVRGLFKWLVRHNHIPANPAADLELPRNEHRLPRHVLTAREADMVMAQPDLTDPMGVRDRAILETFYSTGMRRSELIRLEVFDLDPERGLVTIRQGKGKKDRVIPIGDRAMAWTQRYLDAVRPDYVVEPDDGTLFLSQRGGPIEDGWLGAVVHRYIDRAELGKTGSCHLFRHTMATLMLENGADIRFIQQMLGHATIKSTEVYLQVSVRKLKEIHSVTHPARLDPSHAAAVTTDDDAIARADLFSSLAADLAAEAARDGGA